MAVLLRNTSSVNTGSPTATSFVLPVPTGTVNGDIMIANIVVNTGSSITVTPPSGWNLMTAGANNQSTNLGQRVYYRIASSEPASYTWNFTSCRAAGVCASYSGADNNNPFCCHNASSSASSTTSIAHAPITPQAETVYVVDCIGSKNVTAIRTLSTPSTGFTVEIDTSSTATTFVQAAIQDAKTLTTPLTKFTAAAATESGTITNQCTYTFGLRADISSASGLTSDVAHGANNTTTNTVTSDAFDTGYTNEIVIVFALTASTVIGTSSLTDTAGLTFTKIVEQVNGASNNQKVVIYAAVAASKLSGEQITYTDTGDITAVGTGLTVYTFINGNTSTPTGATNAASSSSGTPSASLTTTARNSWVFGAISYGGSTQPTRGSGQTGIYSFSASASQRGVVQRQNSTTPASGTNVTINDTAPTGVTFCEVVVEILAAAIASSYIPQLTLLGAG